MQTTGLLIVVIQKPPFSFYTPLWEAFSNSPVTMLQSLCKVTPRLLEKVYGRLGKIRLMADYGLGV